MFACLLYVYCMPYIVAACLPLKQVSYGSVLDIQCMLVVDSVYLFSWMLCSVCFAMFPARPLLVDRMQCIILCFRLSPNGCTSRVCAFRPLCMLSYSGWSRLIPIVPCFIYGGFGFSALGKWSFWLSVGVNVAHVEPTKVLNKPLRHCER